MVRGCIGEGTVVGAWKDRGVTQNIYDDEAFLAGYSTLDRSVHGLDGALEWPTIRSMLPSMDDLRVLDLGCGFGWFCRWAATQGARSVVGVDVSEKMLEQAAADTKSAAINYRRLDLDSMLVSDLDDPTFDLVYSSLTLHYLTDLPRLFATVAALLPSGGHFVFSAEHPIFTASRNPGFIENDGSRTWPVDNYMNEGVRTTNWFADGVRKQHRTIAGYLNALLAAGFTLTRLEEFGPTEQQVADDPRWVDERHRPNFLLVAAQRT